MLFRSYLIGEILDCDGRIGGFNFQWAWATGHLAGCAVGRALTQSDDRHKKRTPDSGESE